MVFQPIAHLGTGDVIGAEALARFAPEPRRTPDVWFAEAASVELGTRLELAAVRAAARRLPDLPPTSYLAVNVSPDTAQSRGLAEIIGSLPARRLVLELTEHAGIADYDELADALAPLRESGSGSRSTTRAPVSPASATSSTSGPTSSSSTSV